jgi:FkbM family methyltransferase
VWKRFPVTGEFRVVLPGGGTFLYSSVHGDQIGRALHWRGVDWWESETIEAWVWLVSRARGVLDIGANTGVYTLLACATNPSARVTAFEPVPHIFERLRINVGLNGWDGRCELRMRALGSAAGRSMLHVPDVELPSSASLDRDGFRGLRGRLIGVDVATADSECGGGIVDLVKIDVEGFEHEVLRGMTGILAEQEPAIVLECNPDGPHAQVSSFLRERGYEFVHLRPGRLGAQADIRPDPLQRYRNFLCVPARKLEEVGLRGRR